jgi:hypothetical protein
MLIGMSEEISKRNTLIEKYASAKVKSRYGLAAILIGVIVFIVLVVEIVSNGFVVSVIGMSFDQYNYENLQMDVTFFIGFIFVVSGLVCYLYFVFQYKRIDKKINEMTKTTLDS